MERFDFNENEQEKKEMREELEQYLREFQSKKDSEGNPFVNYPSNFELVSSLMGRNDLKNNNQWSKDLFLSKLDSGLGNDQFEDGRYKNLMIQMNKENEFRKGMAEIEMLDKQLGKLNKRVATIKLETAEMELSADPNIDTTFVTRLITPGGRSTAASSQQSSPLSTARSSNSRLPTSRSISSKSQREKKSSRSSLALDSDEEENAGMDDPSEEKEYPEQTEEEQEGEEQDKEKDEFDRQTTEEDEIASELRIKLLLEDDSLSNDAWMSIMRYGYTKEQQKRMAEIDDQLLQFEIERQEHLPPHLNSKSISTEISEKVSEDEGKLPVLMKGNKTEEAKEITRPEKVLGDNYLKEQHIATVRKKYSQQLDILLTMVKSQEIDLSNLVTQQSSTSPRPNSSSSTTSNSSKTSSSSFLPKIKSISQQSQSNQMNDDQSVDSSKTCSTSIYQITPINSINPNRQIMMSDVQNVINELCLSSSSSNIQKSSKQDIQHLLLSLKEETNQLSELRSQSKNSQQNTFNERRQERSDSKSMMEKNEEGEREGREGGGNERGSYSYRLKEYYQKKKQDEEKESEERMMRESERVDSKPSLSRMSTLELKSSNNISKSNKNNKNNTNNQLSTQSTEKKTNKERSKKRSEEKEVEEIPAVKRELKSSNSLISEMESNFESLQNKMNSMLTRATQVTSTEYEDESDQQMKRLLEEIYMIEPIEWSGEVNENEDENEEVDEDEKEQLNENEAEEVEEEEEDGEEEKERATEEKEGRRERVVYNEERKGIF